jgi:hypothetical protein
MLYALIVEHDGEICRGRYSDNCSKIPAKPGDLEIDHIDGSEHHNCLTNLQLLCHACNVKKGKMLEALKKENPDFDPSWIRHGLCERERERENPFVSPLETAVMPSQHRQPPNQPEKVLDMGLCERERESGKLLHVSNGNGGRHQVQASPSDAHAAPTSRQPVCERENRGAASEPGAIKADGAPSAADAVAGSNGSGSGNDNGHGRTPESQEGHDITRKIGRPIRSQEAYDIVSKKTETSAQRANKKREWRFVDFLVKIVLDGGRFKPEDIINAAAKEFGGSPVAYQRYWEKQSNPINGDFTIDFDPSGTPFVAYKSDVESQRARAHYLAGECAFCGNKRNEGKAMCDNCINRFRESE